MDDFSSFDGTRFNLIITYSFNVSFPSVFPTRWSHLLVLQCDMHFENRKNLTRTYLSVPTMYCCLSNSASSRSNCSGVKIVLTRLALPDFAQSSLELSPWHPLRPSLSEKRKFRNVWSVLFCGGSRISEIGGADSWILGLLFDKIFVENCTKIKEIGLREGVRVPSAPFGSASAIFKKWF